MPPDETPAATSSGEDLLPEGTYRSGEITRDELIATGVAAGFEAGEIEAFIDGMGVIDYVEIAHLLEDGRWTITVSFDGAPDVPAAEGPYEVVDVDTVIAPSNCGEPITLSYTIGGDSLTFDVIDTGCTGFDEPFVQALNYESGPLPRVDRGQ